MTPGSGLLKDNAFLVAAISLPLVVVGFFMLSSAIPRWTVPPPAYDLVLRAVDLYNQTPARAAVDFDVRDGKVEATVRPVAANAWGQRSKLFLFDHATMSVREIPLQLPDDLDNLTEGDPPRRIVVDALVGRQVVQQAIAPDGYQLESPSGRGPGIVGDIFGMHRYESQASLVNKGRLIPIVLPPPFQNNYGSFPYAVGWLVDNGPR
jgi:hypothetical protein